MSRRGHAERKDDSDVGSVVRVVRIPPYMFIHVRDTNTNVTRTECGPKTYTKQSHEDLALGPQAMVCIPPQSYCRVLNPLLRDEEGNPVSDRYGQPRLQFGEAEVRLATDFPDPFPLYPGEKLDGEVQPLKVVRRNTCLRLKALRPFRDADGAERNAGDEWHFTGPGTYVPRVEVEELGELEATIVPAGQALRLRARQGFTDSGGVERCAGEEWLLRTPGAYLPSPDEEVVRRVKPRVLTDRRALHFVAERDFVDVYGNRRRAGEEWLVTAEESATHIVDVHERLKAEVPLTTLSNREFCVVLDPYVDGEQRLGSKELRVGERSFFLQPGESLELGPGGEAGVQRVSVLGDDEALLLCATEGFLDKAYVGAWRAGAADCGSARGAGAGSGAGAGTAGADAGVDHDSASTESWADGEGPRDVQRRAGDRWMVYGPCEYVPPVSVRVLERRRAIPLDKNEGVYVRDSRTGRVSAKVGRTYMLSPTETLWAKQLSPEVEALVMQQADRDGDADHGEGAARDKSRVVTYRVPHNSACQVFDYKATSSRVVFGPDLVMLQPEEEFTIVRLSGSTPKRPNVVASLTLRLGPDFMTDVVTVETADHARLNLTLSYNWQFDMEACSDDPSRVFSVRDFVGDACKAIASRVRGAVAAESFDNFHKYSAKIIRAAVFGMTEDNRIRDRLTFQANALVVTNVDVQSVEPVDERTRESLVKSVQLAIEITTNSQEARAHHEAKREEEEAQGLLQRQQLQNEAEAEAQRRRLLQLRAESAAVETQGQAKAEAEALAEAARITAEADVAQARLRAQAAGISGSAALEQLQAKHREEVAHRRALDGLALARAREMAEIEAKKFGDTVAAIGADTIADIARAGPEMQAKLLQGLGLQGFLVTDGHNPINLFQTAQGMVAPGGAPARGSGGGGGLLGGMGGMLGGVGGSGAGRSAAAASDADFAL